MTMTRTTTTVSCTTTITTRTVTRFKTMHDTNKLASRVQTKPATKAASERAHRSGGRTEDTHVANDDVTRQDRTGQDPPTEEQACSQVSISRFMMWMACLHTNCCSTTTELIGLLRRRAHSTGNCWTTRGKKVQEGATRTNFIVPLLFLSEGNFGVLFKTERFKRRSRACRCRLS
mgnify:FL=1